VRGELPFRFSGVVRPGLRRGHLLGFPTANLEVDEATAAELPRGVFVGQVRWEAQGPHWAVINVGHRPTFAPGALSVEAHLLDFSGDLYGRALEVQLCRFLRGERRFASADELAAQIAADVKTARDHRDRRTTANNTTEV
jgi:riboflavin kinase/FMN adenylyltransferase